MPTPPIVEATTGQNAPAAHAYEVVPSDTVDLPFPCRALLVGGTGDVRVTTSGDDTVTLPGVSGVIPVQCNRVWATGTGAVTIVGLY